VYWICSTLKMDEDYSYESLVYKHKAIRVIPRRSQSELTSTWKPKYSSLHVRSLVSQRVVVLATVGWSEASNRTAFCAVNIITLLRNVVVPRSFARQLQCERRNIRLQVLKEKYDFATEELIFVVQFHERLSKVPYTVLCFTHAPCVAFRSLPSHLN
jgi:hypothetical protein